MKEYSAQQLDLSMMPVNQTAITLGNKILVMDSLQSQQMTEQMKEFVGRFPMKLATSCLLIVVSGEVRFSVNFRDFVARRSTCAVITGGTIIEQVDFDPDTQVILLSFNPNSVYTSTQISTRNYHRIYALQAIVLQLSDQHMSLLKDAYKILRKIISDPAFETNREDTAVSCMNLMGSIIEQGVDNEPQVETKTSRKDEIVARFLECVNESYRTHRELAFYADQLCLSLKYMSHIIYEQTGRHPSQWIKDYVILDAKTMLRSGRYTVQQVADELNFPNQSFFGKYFKEAVGVSPKKWS